MPFKTKPQPFPPSSQMVTSNAFFFRSGEIYYADGAVMYPSWINLINTQNKGDSTPALPGNNASTWVTLEIIRKGLFNVHKVTFALNFCKH